MVKNRIFDDPLTRKWRPKIQSLCCQLRIPFKDGEHEARVHEWEIQQEWKRKHKLTDLEGMERYFCKTIKYRLLDQIKPGGWWDKHVTSHPDLTVVESLITSRSFSELGFDHLTQHVSYMLALIDIVAMEIYLARLTTGLNWSRIKKDRYPDMTKRNFYGYVRDIEDATADAAVLYKEQPWIVSLLR